MQTLKELNKQKMYTKKQLQTLSKFKNKFLNVYSRYHKYWNEEIYRYETVFEVRGVSSTIRENYNLAENIGKSRVW